MNNKIELIEIKRNQTGSGILIENDGYISASIDGNKKLFETLKIIMNGKFPTLLLLVLYFKNMALKMLMVEFILNKY